MRRMHSAITATGEPEDTTELRSEPMQMHMCPLIKVGNVSVVLAIVISFANGLALADVAEGTREVLTRVAHPRSSHMHARTRLVLRTAPNCVKQVEMVFRPISTPAEGSGNSTTFTQREIMGGSMVYLSFPRIFIYLRQPRRAVRSDCRPFYSSCAAISQKTARGHARVSCIFAPARAHKRG
jgi:hypothetical protein